jgi:predicted Zn-dependent protease
LTYLFARSTHTIQQHPILLIGLFGVFAFAPVGCTVNPATGERSFTLYSWEEEKRMGSQAAAGLAAQFGGEVESQIPSRYMHDVGMTLVQGVEEGVPDLDWEFTLLNTDTINAFALPGGKIYMTRGLAEKIDSEAAMAGVLGHEIGHVTARHGNQRISKQIGFNAIITGASVVVGTADEDSNTSRYGQAALPALAIGGNVVLLKYGRDDESQADMLGLRYMERAGYNPVGQLHVMEVLEAQAGRGSQPEWLSTHPYPETRIKQIREYLGTQYAYTQDNAQYVMREAEYERKMIGPLRNLAPPQPADESEAVSLLAQSAIWCAHCSMNPN